MGLFIKTKEPVFLKSGSSADEQLKKLNELKSILNPEGQAIIERDIKYIEYGIIGEKNIEFELKNSHMPFYILHDVYLKHGELSAQIDYLVFTPKMCFVIECKNLFGDIEINSNGDFIRTIEYNGKKKKEGIYSPVTQNERHLELLKSLIICKQKNFISRRIAENSFRKMFIPIVVLANSKTILKNRYAKKEIKNKVIRADQLIQYIKDTYNISDLPVSSESDTKKWAESFLQKNFENEVDYTAKYDRYIGEEISEKSNVNFDKLFDELKSYRLKMSRQENIKPYYIYNDKQLTELINKSPKSIDELKQISGFGEKKAEKYGNDIISILLKRHL
jgi:hypothetical protein